MNASRDRQLRGEFPIDINYLLLTAIAMVNLPLYLLLGQSMFQDWDDFWDCVKYYFTSDIVSAFRGEWWEDRDAERRLLIFLLYCACLVAGEYALVEKWLSR